MVREAWSEFHRYYDSKKHSEVRPTRWTSEDRAGGADGNLWEPRAIWRFSLGSSQEGGRLYFPGPWVSGEIGSKWLEPKLKASPESFLAHAWDLFLDFSESLLSTSWSRSPIQLAGTFLTLAVFCLMNFQQETGQKEKHISWGARRGRFVEDFLASIIATSVYLHWGQGPKTKSNEPTY